MPAIPHGGERTALIVGAYRASGHRHERLLRALPPVLVIKEDVEVWAWVETAAADAALLSAGSQALMDRLLDWVLVCTLRTWFDQAGADAPCWYRGLADPVLAPALKPSTTGPPRPGPWRRWPLEPTSPGRCSPSASPS
ncbi:cupin domain-containing protein [Streptomyces sp. NPDC088760]|uniref:cupin domain-containing protein n=1 Tax=Streptomyces sp. NPDC088760 TaxID=3365890 RepID=UPI00381F0998